MHDEQGLDDLAAFVREGWLRWLPSGGLAVYEAAVRLGAGEDDGGRADEASWRDLLGRGLEAPAWEATAFEDPRDAEEERRHQAERRARVDRIAQDLGLGPVATLGDVVEFERRLGLVERAAAGGRWRTVRPVPRPAERIAMTEAERAEEEALSWRWRYDGAATAVVGLFGDGQRTTTLTTSLERLARRTGYGVEDVRQGVLVLLDGGFAASLDVRSAPPHEVFVLACGQEAAEERRPRDGQEEP